MPTPACYDDLFAFRPDQTCTSPIIPTSGLYIDDLEGISLLSSSSTGKHTYANAQAVLNAKTLLAVQKCESWVQDVLMGRGFIMPQKQVAKNLCSYGTTQAAVSALARGVTLQRSDEATFLGNLYIQNVTYKAGTSGTAMLLIQTISGVTLFASSTTVITANIPAVFNVNAYYAEDVRVLIQTNTAPIDTDCDSSCACLRSVARHNAKAEQMYHIVGFNGLEQDSNGFGVSVCAALRCNIQALMCYILDVIKMPLLYMVGAEIMKEIRALNAPTAQSVGYYGRDHQKETIVSWEKEAARLLQTQIDTIVYQLKDLDHYCISCNTPQKIKIQSLT